MKLTPYNRIAAVNYAHKWAYQRNPAYYNFDSLGGDCTNYASQVIYAGSGVMNFTPVTGWFYRSSYDRTASWTGVEYLYNFLTKNKGPGPFALSVDVSEIKPGDIVQLKLSKAVFSHCPVVVSVGRPASVNNILVAAHTIDVDYLPLTHYNYRDIRFLHIGGVYKY
ncbi:MAG: amidase domain-containing protein [Christensenellales bacterium]|jgi:hypothetical protein